MNPEFLLTIIMLVLCVSTASMPAAARPPMSREEKIAALLKIAKTFPEDRVFYRWQSQTSHDNLIKAGKLTDELMQHFQNITDGDQAGGGVYIATSPSSSIDYGPTILEVHVPKGTPYLDTSDYVVRDELAKLEISTRELYHELDPPILIQYAKEPDWWVLKRKEGIQFNAFTGNKLSPEEINTLLIRLKSYQKKYDAVASTLKPLMQKQLAADAGIIEYGAYQELVSNKEIQKMLEMSISKVRQNPEAVSTAFRVLKGTQHSFSNLTETEQTILTTAAHNAHSPAALKVSLNFFSSAPNIDTDIYHSLIEKALKEPNIKKESIATVLESLKSKNSLWKTISPAKKTAILDSIRALALPNAKHGADPLALRVYIDLLHPIKDGGLAEKTKLMLEWMRHPHAETQINGIEQLRYIYFAEDLHDQAVFDQLWKLFEANENRDFSWQLIRFLKDQKQWTPEILAKHLKNANPIAHAAWFRNATELTNDFDWASIAKLIKTDLVPIEEQFTLAMLRPNYAENANLSVADLWKKMSPEERKTSASKVSWSSPQESRQKLIPAILEDANINGKKAVFYDRLFEWIAKDPKFLEKSEFLGVHKKIHPDLQEIFEQLKYSTSGTACGPHFFDRIIFKFGVQ